VNRFLAVLWLALLALAAPAAAQQLPDRPATPVLDQAQILRPEQIVDISSKAEALQARTGRTFFVATVTSLGDLTIEDYGNQLARKWQPGSAEDDDGVILLVAPNEKKVRIETGYGAEGFLPDILAGRIIRDTIIPRFKAGDMGGGVVAGADAVITQMSLDAEQAQANVANAERRQARQSEDVGFIPVIVIVVIFFVIVSSIARGARGRRYRSRRGGIDPWVVLWGLNEISRASRGGGGWAGGGGFGGFGGSGGGGGSFGSFGGGFGGGGASGSW
jgi:uncharacterized protein